ncbi:surface protein LPXTG motif [Furfurilactobacillus rossiae]|uniref:bacterial Ig-like domain-containing protein n=1 Tax=Furfurilactobacillus rossiae TaxID=231049 RepID=UPI0015C06E6C|nr:bacterial Ig-like domain-containing protein [Furfurilactobacillus rossiae]MCF6165018.1 hypothetical protein [Furfurilactobacillus rossiae]QLE64090.1 surface protein LPXTG motif [Furfurilactobacillus rossiae]
MIEPHRKTTEQKDSQAQNQLRVITNQATVIAQDQTTYVGGPHYGKTSFVKAVYDATGQAVDPAKVQVDLTNVNWDQPADYRINLQYTNPGKTVSATAHLHIFALDGRDITIHAGEPIPDKTAFIKRLVDPGHMANATQNVKIKFDDGEPNIMADNSYGLMLTYTVNGVTAGAHQVLHILENMVHVNTANQTTYVNGPRTNPDRFVQHLYDADGNAIDIEKAIVDMSKVNWQKAGRYPVTVRYTDHGKNVFVTAYENIFSLSAHNQIIVAGDGDPIPARYVADAKDQYNRDRSRWTAMSYDDPTANHKLPGTYNVTLSFEVNGSTATVHPTLQVLPEILRPQGSADNLTIHMQSQSARENTSATSQAAGVRHGLRHMTTGSRVANNAAKEAEKKTRGFWARLFGRK